MTTPVITHKNILAKAKELVRESQLEALEAKFTTMLSTPMGSYPIDPEMAAYIYLYHNNINRKLSLKKIAKLVSDAANGPFPALPEGRRGAFSTTTNDVLSLQHRLVLQILLGITIEYTHFDKVDPLVWLQASVENRTPVDAVMMGIKARFGAEAPVLKMAPQLTTAYNLKRSFIANGVVKNGSPASVSSYIQDVNNTQELIQFLNSDVHICKKPTPYKKAIIALLVMKGFSYIALNGTFWNKTTVSERFSGLIAASDSNKHAGYLVTALDAIVRGVPIPNQGALGDGNTSYLFAN